MAAGEATRNDAQRAVSKRIRIIVQLRPKKRIDAGSSAVPSMTLV
jgi:hypothetical protein